MEKISIILPTYNNEKAISNMIDSVLAQTYQNFELIIVNDGSTDGTKSVLEEYQKKDNRIKVIHQENQGVSAARNTGIANATGTYVTFLDDDDKILPDIFEKLVAKIKEQNVDLVRYNCYYSTKENETSKKASMAGFENQRIEKEELLKVLQKIITGELSRILLAFIDEKRSAR